MESESVPPLEKEAIEKSAGRMRRRGALALGTAETCVWASTFYLFPAMFLVWERELSWSKAQLTGGYTIALLVAALISPLVGVFIDRGLGRYVLSGSAALAGVLLFALAFNQSLPVFFILCVGIGVAMGCGLYESTFAYVIRALRLHARSAIGIITLIAGFAGTVSFTGANVLAAKYGGPVAVASFAVFVLVLGVPTFWYGTIVYDSRLVSGSRKKLAKKSRLKRGGLRRVMRSPTFWFTAASLALIALNHGMLIAHLLPLLEERGIAVSVAVMAASLIGPMQVVGRSLLMVSGDRYSPVSSTTAYMAGIAMAVILLVLAGVQTVAVLSFASLYGISWGVASILKPLLIREFLGKRGYGLVTGLLAIPFLGATALGPFLGSLIWQEGGYGVMLKSGLAMSVLALICHLTAYRFYLRRRRINQELKEAKAQNQAASANLPVGSGK